MPVITFLNQVFTILTTVKMSVCGTLLLPLLLLFLLSGETYCKRKNQLARWWEFLYRIWQFCWTWLCWIWDAEWKGEESFSGLFCNKVNSFQLKVFDPKIKFCKVNNVKNFNSLYFIFNYLQRVNSTSKARSCSWNNIIGSSENVF